MKEPYCPDCGRPVVSHALYKDGRCPAVRFPHYELDPAKPPTPRLGRP